MINILKKVRFLIVSGIFSVRQMVINAFKILRYITLRKRREEWSIQTQYSASFSNKFLIRDFCICFGLISSFIRPLQEKSDNYKKIRYTIRLIFCVDSLGVSYEMISQLIDKKNSEICFRLGDEGKGSKTDRDDLHLRMMNNGTITDGQIPISYQTFIKQGRGSTPPHYYSTWARNKIKSLPPGSFVIGISFFNPSAGIAGSDEYGTKILHDYIKECPYYYCILFDPPGMSEDLPFIERTRILFTKKMGFSFIEEISLIGALDLFIGSDNEYAVHAINHNIAGYIVTGKKTVYDIRQENYRAERS